VTQEACDATLIRSPLINKNRSYRLQKQTAVSAATPTITLQRDY